MPVPDFEQLMLPLLRFAADGKEHTMQEVIAHVGEVFQLSSEDKAQLLPSGKQTVIANRAHWARTYMGKAGLLSFPRRGVFKITQRGLDILNQNPQQIDVKLLDRFPEFTEFHRGKSDGGTANARKEKLQPLHAQTPEELLQRSYSDIRQRLAEDLLDRVNQNPPEFFEKLVLDLLERMYQKRGKITGRSGDGGIDGEIPGDPLGLDPIHVQAKRWQDVVGRPEIQKFVGALAGQHSQKGIFITTSGFSSEARTYVNYPPLKGRAFHEAKSPSLVWPEGWR